MIAQSYGNAKDPQQGRQMPNHYGARDVNYVPVSSPVGTQIPQAVGAAWAAKIRKDDVVALTYFGDGATSEGDFHAAMNFAGVFKTPTIFFCKNNQWAISVPVTRQTASKTLAQKALAYGFDGLRVDGNDLLAVYAVTKAAADKARSGGGPTMIEAVTYRMGPNSSSDGPRCSTSSRCDVHGRPDAVRRSHTLGPPAGRHPAVPSQRRGVAPSEREPHRPRGSLHPDRPSGPGPRARTAMAPHLRWGACHPNRRGCGRGSDRFGRLPRRDVREDPPRGWDRHCDPGRMARGRSRTHADGADSGVDASSWLQESRTGGLRHEHESAPPVRIPRLRERRRQPTSCAPPRRLRRRDPYGSLVAGLRSVEVRTSALSEPHRYHDGGVPKWRANPREQGRARRHPRESEGARLGPHPSQAGCEPSRRTS